MYIFSIKNEPMSESEHGQGALNTAEWGKGMMKSITGK